MHSPSPRERGSQLPSWSPWPGTREGTECDHMGRGCLALARGTTRFPQPPGSPCSPRLAVLGNPSWAVEAAASPQAHGRAGASGSAEGSALAVGLSKDPVGSGHHSASVLRQMGGGERDLLRLVPVQPCGSVVPGGKSLPGVVRMGSGSTGLAARTDLPSPERGLG